jgi:hypothetical protein
MSANGCVTFSLSKKERNKGAGHTASCGLREPSHESYRDKSAIDENYFAYTKGTTAANRKKFS